MSAALERIDLRTTAETKSLITRAAATRGLSVSAFLLSAAREHAQSVLGETESITLTPRDWDAFMAALDHLDKPRPKLTAAMQRYHAWQSQEAGP